MNLRYLVPVFVLIAVAVFLIFRPDDGSQEKAGKAGRRAGNEAALGSAGNDEGEERNRKVSSKRVLRERPKVVTTESGLQYEVLTEGEGEYPGPESKVKVHYVGTKEDGIVFDSSRDRGEPAVFPLNAVIKGWTEGLQLMKPGAIYRFVIPPELGYGARGAGSILGDSTLTFEVELISIEKP